MDSAWYLLDTERVLNANAQIRPALSKMTTKGEGSLNAFRHNQSFLTAPRPISRAYVYSLVERIALLESLLEDHGLAVPPATHPPETRHRSRRSDGNQSVDHTVMSSSTSQDSTTSESHTASSPCSSDDLIRDELPATRTRKRSPIDLETNFTDANRKRTRHDSLIEPVNVKIESPTRALDETAHLNDTCELNQYAMPPPPTLISLWPTVRHQTGGQMTMYSTLQTTRVDDCGYSVWVDRPFEFQSCDQYSQESQHSIALPTEHQYIDTRSVVGGNTNLDFMTLSASS